MNAWRLAIVIAATVGLSVFGLACEGNDEGGVRLGGEADDSDGVGCDAPLSVSAAVVMDTSKAGEVDMLVMATDQCDQGVDLSVDEITVEESTDGDEWLPVGINFRDLGVMSVSLTMDFSGSMEDYIDDLRHAVRIFVDQLDDNDEAQIIKFSTDVEVVQNFTSNTSELHSAIDAGWDYAGGATALYESTGMAVEEVAAQEFPRATVAFTDGVDTMTEYDDIENQIYNITHQATQSGVPVFTVGLGYVDTEILSLIADETNGLFFNAPQEEELEGIYRKISGILSTANRLNYESNFDEGEVRVRITINHPAGDLVLYDQIELRYTFE
ncbi:VWA domain-containing protein [bacterium]|nr:VWA domain-containing protein [bacterium]